MSTGRRRALAAASLSVVLLLTLAATALAKIVVNRSIDRVELGTTMKGVRHLLGRPRSVVDCSVFAVCLPGASSGTVSWTYGRGEGTSYAFIKGRVALMGTFLASERTAAGVGPGTTLATARRRYPHLAFRRFPPGEPPSGYYVTGAPKKTGDDFTLLVMYPHAGATRVDWVEVGRWNAAPRYVCDFSICS